MEVNNSLNDVVVIENVINSYIYEHGKQNRLRS